MVCFRPKVYFRLVKYLNILLCTIINKQINNRNLFTSLFNKLSKINAFREGNFSQATSYRAYWEGGGEVEGPDQQ